MTRSDLQALLRNTLPTMDLVDVPEEVLNEYIDHALFLRETSPYCRDVPEDLFLHFVFYPRVNSENLEACRVFFYSQLRSRIEDLCGTDAALEINRWCAEHVTYQSSDDRTESPMTAYRSGFGRCGEESTFCVSAMRSVGIPARQVYVPWWAHCDDNHAWVEVYVDGSWHFLGACEPEPILDRGWFLDASSRAPMVHYRTFFDCSEGDPLVGTEGIIRLYSVTRRYAETGALNITVTCTEGADVDILVPNMGAFRKIAGGKTDGSGQVSLELGKGTYHVEVRSGSKTAWADVTVPGSICLKLADWVPCSYDTDAIAPAVTVGNRSRLTPVQETEKSETLNRCNAIRNALHKEADDTLLDRFAAKLPESDHSLALTMLNAMAVKDRKDTDVSLLLHHWNAAYPYRDTPGFAEEILNPRIADEMLSEWRGVGSKLPDDDSLWEYIRRTFPDGNGRYTPTAYISPEGILRAGCADEKSRALLYVAVLRSRGIGARLNPVDGIPEYRSCSVWKSTADRSAALTLVPEKDNTFVNGTNYSLSRLEADGFRVLGAFSGTAALIPGIYRLTTANRLPNGNQLCRTEEFRLGPGEHRTIPLSLRQARPEEMLAQSILDPFFLMGSDGSAVCDADLLTGKTLLIYLQTGQEPTEHILNELLAAKDSMDHLNLILIPGSRHQCADPLLCRVLDAFPGAKLLLGSDVSGIQARKMFLEPGVFPLMILTDRTRRGYYGSCGYNVGSVELAQKLAAVIDTVQ